MAGTATVTVLGCGGSGGVPLATNFWGYCNPENPKNNRMRASIAIRTAQTSVIIDTSPEFRIQTQRFGIDRIDAVLYTHPHSDHVNGIDDLRYVAAKHKFISDEKHKVPIYTDEETLAELTKRHDHLFVHSANGLYEPVVEPHLIGRDCDPVVIHDELVFQPFYQVHGYGKSLGYKIGDFAYSTDVSDFDEAVLDRLKGVRTWIVDCGQYGSDFIQVHPNLERVMEWNAILGAEKLYLTHLTPRTDYDTIMNETPDHIEPAYDGLKITINL